MKGFINIIIIVFSVSILVACKKKDRMDYDPEARELFNFSTETINNYMELIKNCTDSTQVDSLLKSLDKKITDLNFSFPPETDLKLNEQENDSIFELMGKIRKISKEKYESFVIEENIQEDLDEL